MKDRAWYTTVENWHGSFLEVAIDLGTRDDARLLAAFRAAWASPLLTGPLDSPHPGRAAGILEPPLDPEASIFTNGIIAVPSAGREIGCTILSVRDPTSDWLDIAIPTGMLALAYPVRYPLFDDANPWISEVERRLVDVADGVYAEVPFDLATVGEETSGNFYATGNDPNNTITREVVDRAGGFLLSPRLWTRLAPAIEAETLPSGVLWVPPTSRGYWSG